jgi:septal ring factor EnvC (AmiA/AmiB activator)
MSKFPSGFLAAFVLLCLALVAASPSSGQEMVISESQFQGLQIAYTRLVTLSNQLALNLQTLEDQNLKLSEDLRLSKDDLNASQTSLTNSQRALARAERSNEDLRAQLETSEESLTRLQGQIRRGKVKAYTIGGVVGLVVGGIVTAFILN